MFTKKQPKMTQQEAPSLGKKVQRKRFWSTFKKVVFTVLFLGFIILGSLGWTAWQIAGPTILALHDLNDNPVAYEQHCLDVALYSEIAPDTLVLWLDGETEPRKVCLGLGARPYAKAAEVRGEYFGGTYNVNTYEYFLKLKKSKEVPPTKIPQGPVINTGTDPNN